MSNGSRKNIMIFSPSRSGSTLLSLILGAHSEITNYGESHWACYDDQKKNPDHFRGCRAHGEDCAVLAKIRGSEMNYSDHFKTLFSHSDTDNIVTSNKKGHHYLKMDYMSQNNYILLLIKPFEVWVGSFLGGKIKLEPTIEATLEKLAHNYYSYFKSTLDLLSNDEQLSRGVLVDYSKLTDEKEEYVKKICGFLEIEFEKGMMEFNSYLMSGDKDQHPIGGNIKTYGTLNKGRDDRYDHNQNNIFAEEKHRMYLDENLISRLREDRRAIELRQRLQSLNQI